MKSNEDVIFILVGSLNPVKIQAVKDAASEYWTNITVDGRNVNSEVSDMPLSKNETRIGAKNRAHNVLSYDDDANIGIGLEGGICFLDKTWYLFGATYATNGKTGSWGGETLMRLPEYINSKIGDGSKELGLIMDEITGKNNIKQKEGAVGYLTNKVITRTDVFRMSVKMALSTFANSNI